MGHAKKQERSFDGHEYFEPQRQRRYWIVVTMCESKICFHDMYLHIKADMNYLWVLEFAPAGSALLTNVYMRENEQYQGCQIKHVFPSRCEGVLCSAMYVLAA